jgi:hypothetical protein
MFHTSKQTTQHNEIRANIVDTVDIIATIKPLYNFKETDTKIPKH